MSAKHQLHTAWLSLGGNLGDSKANFLYTLKCFANHPRCELKAVSSLYLTAAWGNEQQPDFFNACIEIETYLNPHELLDICLSIETDKQRVRNEKWGPRSLDIDILLYESYQITDARLTIPHPYLSQRAFVVIPLAEIAPNLIIDGLSLRDRANIMQVSKPKIKKIATANEWAEAIFSS